MEASNEKANNPQQQDGPWPAPDPTNRAASRPPRAGRNRQILSGLAVVMLGVLVAALGLSAVPREWIVAGTAVLTLTGLCLGHAQTEAITPEAKAKSYGWAIITLVAFIVGIGAYNLHFDPSRGEAKHLWAVVLNAPSDDQCLWVSGEPGGQQLYLDSLNRPLAPLCGGMTHFVECRQRLDDQSSWLRLAGGLYWVPEPAVRPPRGGSALALPGCN
jgi:hypothetical protein